MASDSIGVDMGAVPKHVEFGLFRNRAEELAELRDIIARDSFATGDYTLASGRKSKLYFNMKPTIMAARGNRLAAREFLRIAQELNAECIGGLEMGAVPIISTVSGISEDFGAPIQAFFVRKKPKEHGTKLLVEGLRPGMTLADRHVVMADDVTTSGGSVWQAAEVALAAGAKVDAVISLVDREEGAEEYLAERGLRLHPIFRARDFVS